MLLYRSLLAFSRAVLFYFTQVARCPHVVIRSGMVPSSYMSFLRWQSAKTTYS